MPVGKNGMSEAILQTRAEAKLAEKAEFVARVAKALAEAHAIADRTAEQNFAIAPTDPVGFESCATDGVDRPSYRLREALKSLGEIERFGVNWHISTNWGHICDRRQSLMEVIGTAVADYLQEQFPDDGTFYHYVFVSDRERDRLLASFSDLRTD